MSKDVSVMVLDDENIVCERLRGPLTEKGYGVEAFTDSQRALERLAEKHFDVVITDLKMKGPTGLDVLHYLRDHDPAVQVIIITGYATIEAAREAEWGGVYQFVTKPFQIKELLAAVGKAARKAGRVHVKGEG
jgi:DNA-binding NtrC family response regulator